MCKRSINNIPYIKICVYVRIYIFWGSFAQLKCDGFLEWMNESLYHTLERNGHEKVRANFLTRQLQSCLALRTRNKNLIRAFCLKIGLGQIGRPHKVGAYFGIQAIVLVGTLSLIT